MIATLFFITVLQFRFSKSQRINNAELQDQFDHDEDRIPFAPRKAVPFTRICDTVRDLCRSSTLHPLNLPSFLPPHNAMFLARRHIPLLYGEILQRKLLSGTSAFPRPYSNHWVSKGDRSTLCTKRTSFTRGGVTIEHPTQEAIDEMEAEEAMAQDFYSPDGKLIYSLDPDKLNGEVDWKEFERAFGIDHLHNVKDLENWDFELQDKDGDDLETKIHEGYFTNVEQEAHEDAKQYIEHQRKGPPTPEEKKRREEAEQERQRQRELKEESHWNDFENFVQHSLKNPSYTVACHLERDKAGVSDKGGEDFKRTKSKRQAVDDGTTHKLERRRMATRKNPTMSSTNDSSSGRSQQLHKHTPRRAADVSVSESLGDIPMPTDTRRMGYERRIQSLQSQMERIASKQLSSSNSEFEQLGATMHHVMLSTDGFTLKIFFDVDDMDMKQRRVSPHNNEEDNRMLSKKAEYKHNKKMFTLWQRRVENSVRAALAAQMYAKRVPKVELVQVRADGSTLSDDGGGQNANIDDLFDRISAERESNGDRDQQATTDTHR